jgi:zinc protease
VIRSQRLSVLVALTGALMVRQATAQTSRPEPKQPATTQRRGAAATARSEILPFKAVERTLANGLKVIVVPTGFPNLVSLQIPVQTGSRNEVEPGKSGFAHFFEHMMFRGTRAYPPEQYQAILTAAGARQNAYTTDDYTNYHTTFAKEDLETILRIEADRFQNLDYPEAAFRTESRAVLGEYNKNSADPMHKLIEVQRDHAFTTHTYQHTTMGFLRDIEDMPNQYAYSRTFFRRWYRPEYATVIVCGDVNPSQVLRLVQKYWGGWKRGSYQTAIPSEPPAKGPIVAHVAWPTPTLTWVTTAFHGPAFSETAKDYAALDLLLDLTFGPTSELYKRLVEEEQKVDQLWPYFPASADPGLMTVAARVKSDADALYVRDEVLKAFARIRSQRVGAQRLADAKSNARYGLSRTLDNTEAIAATLARFVRFHREYETLNRLFRVYDALTPADLLIAARKYIDDANLVVTTLSNRALPESMAQPPRLADLVSGESPANGLRFVRLISALPEIDVKLLFSVGSAHDPKGKEGLAALAASMIADAGSQAQTIDEIRRALFPMAARFDAQVDKEMTTFTARVHRDNWERFAETALPMLLDPGFREDDFRRIKDQHLNVLTQDLRSENEEELAKEQLAARLFAGTPYGHPVLGTVAGLQSITLDDVRQFVRSAYTRAALTVGLSGNAAGDVQARLERDLSRLSAGPALAAPFGVVARRPQGIEVEIIQKDTRATAISLGHPIEVTRGHPDFVALSVARTWLGEHRSSMSHLYERMREIRGMNYGDYAYIEAFPHGMFQFFPEANVARRAQLFEIWIRPVLPENAQMALRIALYELAKLIDNGLSQEEFEATRTYMMKNVYLLTATQDLELGYALDSNWYGIDEYTAYMRERLAHLTREEVNQALRKHLSSRNLSIVIVAKDAQALRDALVADSFSPIHYEGEKPAALLAEDKVIGGLLLGIRPEAVAITPVDEVFAR